MIDHAVDRAAARAGRWRLSHRPRLHSGAETRRPGSAVPFLDRIVWLESATRQVERIEFPNTGLKKFAGEVVAAADARKKTLAASYRQDIRLVPALQAEYNAYDPGWSRW